ncbi:MAG: hypothetical protein NTU44_16680, partial [Bacteroidetes bacterium]|nr:hypothetical protein [Bacteroidota bacterium]
NSGMLLAFFWICQLSIVNCQFARAQLSVSNDNSAAHPSAMFEVKSADKGLLPPRMTTAQRDAIANPAEGLYLFNLDKNMMEFFNGTEWRQFSYPSSANVTCGNDFIDFRDNQVYATVQIGTQCWMKKNLNVGTMIPGANSQANNSIIEKYCYYSEPDNCTVYGGLYQWDEMMQYATTEGVQGICPSGWHIPTDAEWNILTQYLGGMEGAGGKMKETGTTHWLLPNTWATNESGFTALGAGYRNYYSIFGRLKFDAFFWSSSEGSASFRITRYVGTDYGSISSPSYDKTLGFSVRCVKTN